VAHENGYNVIIAQSKDDFEKEVSSLQYLASRSVDGIIFSVSAETSNFSHIQQLYARGMNMVSFDRVVDFPDIHKVSVDNYKAAYEATTHFINNGFTNIACFANAAFLSITKERVEGYLAALKENNIKVNPDNIFYCLHGGLNYEEVEEIMQKAMNGEQRPDAILACSDKITTSVMRYCQQENIAIPNVMGLVGFSNLDLTDLLAPSLTVVRQPAYEMGRIAAELLIKQIESKRPIKEFEDVVIATELHQRASSEKRKA
jgi:LacI family transcriptional regulator